MINQTNHSKMKHLLLPPLLIALLLSACSKPEEESNTVEAPSPVDRAPEAAEPKTATEKINYLPVLIKTVQGAQNIVALQNRFQAIQTVIDNKNRLSEQLSQETSTEKLQELNTAFTPIEQSFTEQNDQFIKSYGIDLNSTNEYFLVAQKTEVLVQQDDDFIVTKTLDNAQLIKQFQSDLQQVSQIQEYITRLNEALETTTVAAEQSKISAQLVQSRERFTQSNNILFENYGYTFARPSKSRTTEIGIYSQPQLPKLNETLGVPDDYLDVGDLIGVETNLEFQNNLKVMEAARQHVGNLNQTISTEADEAKKLELQKKLDAHIAQLQQNNVKMIEAYNYSIDRNYAQIVTKARLYIEPIPVSVIQC
jgi:hypothetical protein